MADARCPARGAWRRRSRDAAARLALVARRDTDALVLPPGVARRQARIVRRGAAVGANSAMVARARCAYDMGRTHAASLTAALARRPAAALVTTAHMPAALAASYLACGAAAAYTLSTPTAPSSAAE